MTADYLGQSVSYRLTSLTPAEVLAFVANPISIVQSMTDARESQSYCCDSYALHSW